MIPFGIRPTLWPTVFTVPALIVLVALGTWQVNRLAWKEALIDERQARAAQDPAAFPGADADPAAWNFRAVRATGTFLHDKELYLAARTLRGNVGWQVVTPFRRADGSVILVNRGWVPQDYRDPATRAAGQPTGPVVLSGVARTSQIQHWVQPDNEPERNRWFFLDVAAMAAAAGVTPAGPFYLEADAAENPGGLPIGGQARIDLPNNHLQYAVTWYSLAVTLLVIYILYHRRRHFREETA